MRRKDCLSSFDNAGGQTLSRGSDDRGQLLYGSGKRRPIEANVQRRTLNAERSMKTEANRLPRRSLGVGGNAEWEDTKSSLQSQELEARRQRKQRSTTESIRGRPVNRQAPNVELEDDRPQY